MTPADILCLLTSGSGSAQGRARVELVVRLLDILIRRCKAEDRRGLLEALLMDRDSVHQLILMACQPVYIEKASPIAAVGAWPAGAASTAEGHRFKTQITESQAVGRYQLVWRDGVVEETGESSLSGAISVGRAIKPRWWNALLPSPLSVLSVLAQELVAVNRSDLAPCLGERRYTRIGGLRPTHNRDELLMRL